ncbi:EamA family transporter [Streptacidiphilus monticola]
MGCAGTAIGGLLLLGSGRGALALLWRSTGRDRLLLVLGALAVAVYPASFYPAVARTGVAVATVLALGSAPVFTGLLAWLGGGERPGARRAAATAAAVAGCAGLVLGPQLTGGAAQLDVAGVALALLAGFGYAGYAVLGGRLVQRGEQPEAVLGAMFGLAAVPLAAPVLLFGGAELVTPARAWWSPTSRC